jgi:hypothetical protein
MNLLPSYTVRLKKQRSFGSTCPAQDDDHVPNLVWTIADHVISRLSSWRARE